MNNCTVRGVSPPPPLLLRPTRLTRAAGATTKGPSHVCPHLDASLVPQWVHHWGWLNPSESFSRKRPRSVKTRMVVVGGWCDTRSFSLLDRLWWWWWWWWQPYRVASELWVRRQQQEDCDIPSRWHAPATTVSCDSGGGKVPPRRRWGWVATTTAVVPVAWPQCRPGLPRLLGGWSRPQRLLVGSLLAMVVVKSPLVHHDHGATVSTPTTMTRPKLMPQQQQQQQQQQQRR